MKFQDFAIAEEGILSKIKGKLMPYSKDTPLPKKLENLKKDAKRVRAQAYSYHGNMKDVLRECFPVLDKVSKVPLKDDKSSELAILIKKSVSLIHSIDTVIGMTSGGLTVTNGASGISMKLSDVEEAYDNYMN